MLALNRWKIECAHLPVPAFGAENHVSTTASPTSHHHVIRRANFAPAPPIHQQCDKSCCDVEKMDHTTVGISNTPPKTNAQVCASPIVPHPRGDHPSAPNAHKTANQKQQGDGLQKLPQARFATSHNKPRAPISSNATATPPCHKIQPPPAHPRIENAPDVYPQRFLDAL